MVLRDSLKRGKAILIYFHPCGLTKKWNFSKS